MGGKSSGAATPPPAMPMMPQQDNSEEMMAFMTMMMQAMNSMPQAPAVPTTPTIQKEAPIDWAEKHDMLTQKMKAEYTLDQARRKGRQNTVYTSPLLDEEEANTTSIMAGNESA